MKFPDKFFQYFLIAALILMSGIVCVMIENAILHPAVTPLGPAELRLQSEYYAATIVPAMAKVFPLLLFLNAGVALFILLVPLFWVWVWWFNRDLLGVVIRMMQGTVCILMWALGHNSFVKIYVTYHLLPLPIIARMYLPHGWLEMLSFVLAGTAAFLTIDALKTYLQENARNEALHPGDICLFILGRAWKIGLVIFAFMAIAAAIECFVTPQLVKSALEVAVMAAGS
jgi:hypothetical protein